MDVNNTNNSNDQKGTNPTTPSTALHSNTPPTTTTVPITPNVPLPTPTANPAIGTPPAKTEPEPVFTPAAVPVAPSTPAATPAATPTITVKNSPKDMDFPFKSIETEQPSKSDEKIGLNLADETVDAEVKTTPNESKTDPASMGKDFQPMTSSANSTATATPNHTKSVITVLTVAIAFMGLGLFGGYYGFKYSPKITKLFSATADTVPTNSQTNVVNPPKSTSVTAGDVSVWPIYTNSFFKYSIKYPDNWYSQGTADSMGKTLSFTSFNPADSQVNGYEVDFATQSLNGKTLKDWITNNNTVTGTNSGTVVPSTIDNQNAYQQTNTGSTPNIITYVQRGDSVLIVTYTAPAAQFSAGQDLYNKIITSITLS